MKTWEKPELIELDIKNTAYGTKLSEKIDNEYIDENGTLTRTYS